MEFPEPYHSLPIRNWREHIKSHPDSYATIGEGQGCVIGTSAF